MGLYSMISCEKCNKELPFFYTTIEYMVGMAKEQGWMIADDYESYCPSCKEKYLADLAAKKECEEC